ncbi:glutathione S-transferase [Photobacterium sp. 2_MG-2023]|uniref:glutathione S-transferase family protein n=1 Tax=Photobacterium TaxID=657 RepID=UPI001C47E4C3|nr:MULTISPECIES: glutathione S-transferase [Photobacterium]MBV7262962.1 glutathione S-transferase [Photobacterium sp. WH24]MDO6582099.1 glutathione S-transferase [Photobacterium sp. 2_MG-2023]
MKIYELAPSPSARRVSIFLAEMGIDVERISIDIRGGENLSDAFQAKSQNGLIPVLELDDGTTISESVAICRYFDETHPSENSLFGNTPLEKAQVEMWQRIVELKGLFVALQAFRNITGVYKDRETCVESWGEVSRQRLIAFLPVLDKRLSESAFVAGERFSIADITAFVMCHFMEKLHITVDGSLPHIQAWLQAVSQRPSVSQQ